MRPLLRTETRLMAQRALSRAAGAPLIEGNAVKILIDATDNYPAWLEALSQAERLVLFENYIFDDDEVGRTFATALAKCARRGVKVRLLHDWMGSFSTPRRFWRELEAAGVEVRVYNPLRLESPLGWLSRDHRKMIAIDGRIAFVSGLCVSHRWKATSLTHPGPWRDTGVEIRGPAVGELELAFADVWDDEGAPIPESELTASDRITPAGEVAMRVVSTTPYTAGLFRLDQMIAGLASKRLWITDAYFVGLSPYVQALRTAAQDGVDVRLLVPGSSDVPWVSPVTRAGYRPLLEAGVRVFEWKGLMLHAKTAVADGRWARVGSTNLNITSWIANCELDVAVENEDFAAQMEAIYERDLNNATEIVIGKKYDSGTTWARSGVSGGRAGRTAAGALRFGHAMGAALTNRKRLDNTERRISFFGGLLALLVGTIAAVLPQALAWPLAVFLTWLGLSLLWGTRRKNAQPKADPNKIEAT